MKLFSFLAVSALAVHSTTGTFTLAKNIVDRSVANTDALVKKVLSIGDTSTSLDVHFARKPACSDCDNSSGSTEAPTTEAPSTGGFASKGRYYYYPTSYYYPPTAFYYYPNYVVPHTVPVRSVVPAHHTARAVSAQRRVGHALQAQPQQQYNYGSIGYFVYPSNVNHKDVKPVQVHDYYQPAYPGYSGYQPQPFSFYGVAPVHPSVRASSGVPAVIPPFSKIVRQKSGRPYVGPKHRGGYGGYKGGDGGTKGGSSSTTEAPEQQQEQEQEQEQEQTTDAPVKGYY